MKKKLQTHSEALGKIIHTVTFSFSQIVVLFPYAARSWEGMLVHLKWQVQGCCSQKYCRQYTRLIYICHNMWNSYSADVSM